MHPIMQMMKMKLDNMELTIVTVLPSLSPLSIMKVQSVLER